MTRSDDEVAILALQARWLAAEAAGRFDDLCALMTEDIVLQPPIGAPVEGLAAVRVFLGGEAAEVEGIELSDVTLQIDGALAVKRARFRTRLAGGGTEMCGRHVWVLRAPWRISFVAWSLDAAPS